MKVAPYVAKGDIVQYETGFGSRRRTITLKVKDVHRRYGRRSRYKLYMRQLIYSEDVKTGELHHVDSGLVRIIERYTGSLLPPKNIFEQRDDVKTIGGKYMGTLRGISESVLSRLSMKLDRPINLKRLHTLYWKDRRGLVHLEYRSGNFAVITVRRKPFEKWVRQNATRLMKTVKELEREESEVLVSNRRAMEADLAMLSAWQQDAYERLENERSALQQETAWRDAQHS